MLARRYLLKGRRLFTLDKIGHTKISCAQCHKAAPTPKHLHGVWDRYPRYHPGLDRMSDIEDAVNYCIEKHMGGQPLRPGTPSSIAMQIYLKSLK
jgi:cytochrome c